MSSETILLTPKEVAALIGCSIRKLERHRVAGDGPPYAKLGALVRYPAGELEAWIRSRTRHSTSEGGTSDAALPKPKSRSPIRRRGPSDADAQAHAATKDDGLAEPRRPHTGAGRSPEPAPSTRRVARSMRRRPPAAEPHIIA